MPTEKEIKSGRAKCPKCGRKGVGYANHPHAFGYKDTDRAMCRYCNAMFRCRHTTADPATGEAT